MERPKLRGRFYSLIFNRKNISFLEKMKRHKINITKHVHTASNTTRMMMTQKMIADVMLYQWLRQRFDILWNSLNLQ